MTAGPTFTPIQDPAGNEPISPWERAAVEGEDAIQSGLVIAHHALLEVIGWAGTLGEDTERLEAVKLSVEVLLRERQ